MVRIDTLYKSACDLRKVGKSYSLISSELGVPKSTLSGWFAKENWSEEIKNNLNNARLSHARENLIAANEARNRKDQSRRQRYEEMAIAEFSQQVKNPLFLIGLSLYWGEGDKVDNGRVSVINSDPELLQIIGMFYRRCLHIPIGQLRAGLFIYEDIDKEFALEFWSNKLEIPRKQFIKVQLLPSRSNLTKRRSQYGVCSLYFSSTEFSIRIHKWIKMLTTDMRV